MHLSIITFDLKQFFENQTFIAFFTFTIGKTKFEGIFK